jgi:hypothetical protein
MKRLIILALFVPFSSFAQRLEIAEQVGYSTTTDFTIDGARVYGFSNQLSVGYRCLKHFSVSAFYEFNNWNNRNNTYGVSPDFVTKHFYAGLDLQMAKFATITMGSAGFSSENFNTSWGYGLHIGSKQRIFKGLSFVEQIGYNMDFMRFNEEWKNPFGAVGGESRSINATSYIWYLRAGLSYRT